MDDMRKTNAKNVVLLYEYMHRNVYDTHHLRVNNDAQMMTESIIDDTLLQATPHIQPTIELKNSNSTHI